MNSGRRRRGTSSPRPCPSHQYRVLDSHSPSFFLAAARLVAALLVVVLVTAVHSSSSAAASAAFGPPITVPPASLDPSLARFDSRTSSLRRRMRTSAAAAVRGVLGGGPQQEGRGRRLVVNRRGLWEGRGFLASSSLPSRSNNGADFGTTRTTRLMASQTGSDTSGASSHVEERQGAPLRGTSSHGSGGGLTSRTQQGASHPANEAGGGFGGGGAGVPRRRCFTYYLGVGSNVGDRFDNVRRAVQLLERSAGLGDDDDNTTVTGSPLGALQITRTSFLYETPPMYLSDQPNFLNAAIRVEGSLPVAAGGDDEDGIGQAATHELLRRIKRVELHLGRELQSSPMYVRNGPRPIDLDILMGEWNRFDDNHNSNPEHPSLPVVFHNDNLTVPHPCIAERRFVLVPLGDVAGREYRHPVTGEAIGDMLRSTTELAGEIRVLPLPRHRFLKLNRTIVMGILNVTPDSFSDGNQFGTSADDAARQALAMVRDGADIVDVGGESTRPGAKPVSVEDELNRVIPVIRQIRSHDPNIPISIDTRNSRVAREAVEAGADIVNDVSAGRHDPDMFRTVADLGVPVVLMHMRGTPETMRELASYDEARGGVVSEVARELEERCRAAEEAGIHRWMQVVDPGIGFAKALSHNLQLLAGLEHLRSATGNLPILLGTSRKGFIGSLTCVTRPSDRDPGTIASVVAALCLDPTPNACNIIRVHNVADCKQAVQVMDAVRNGCLDQL